MKPSQCCQTNVPHRYIPSYKCFRELVLDALGCGQAPVRRGTLGVSVGCDHAETLARVTQHHPAAMLCGTSPLLRLCPSVLAGSAPLLCGCASVRALRSAGLTDERGSYQTKEMCPVQPGRKHAWSWAQTSRAGLCSHAGLVLSRLGMGTVQWCAGKREK